MKQKRLTILLVVFISISTAFSLSGFQINPGDRLSIPAAFRFQNATSVCYAIGDNGGGPPGNDMLTQVDFDLGIETPIGSPGTFHMEAIAFQATSGILFGADAGQLGTLDLNTGSFTAMPNAFGTGDGALGPINLNDADGLAFDPFNGILYASHRRSGGTNVDLLFQADPTIGMHVQDAFGFGVDYVVIQPVLGFYDIDDIAIDPLDEQLYAIANNSGAGDRLVKINRLTGATDDVGSVGVNDMEGLTFDPTGQLLGTTGKDGPASTNNKLYRIDKSTGLANVSSAKPLTNASDYEGVDCLTSWSQVPTPTPTPTETPIPTTPTPTPTGTVVSPPTFTPTPSPTAPTAVQLIYFSVDSVLGRQVILKWATASEIDNYGFKLVRSSINNYSTADQIAFIFPVGGISGAIYQYSDTIHTIGEWYYWLVDQDTHGQETVHGPVSASISAGFNFHDNLIFLPLVLQP